MDDFPLKNSTIQLGKNDMQKKALNFFIYSSATLLLIVAIAKIISARGSAHILSITDPILGVSFRFLFGAVGTLELLIAGICFLGTRVGLKLGLLAWLASSFLVYRIGMLWVGYAKPCPCLGNLTDSLRISPHTADVVMRMVLAYLLIGSYTASFWFWNQRKKAVVSEIA